MARAAPAEASMNRAAPAEASNLMQLVEPRAEPGCSSEKVLNTSSASFISSSSFAASQGPRRLLPRALCTAE